MNETIREKRIPIDVLDISKDTTFVQGKKGFFANLPTPSFK